MKKKLLALAILLRVLVMPFFYHPDIKTYSFQSSFLGKRVFNIYKYLLEKQPSLPLKEEFVYQPLTYLFLGGYQVLASPLLGSEFDAWLWDASSRVILSESLYRYLFVLKLPILVFDLLVGFMIYKLYSDRRVGEKAVSLWLFNPFTVVVLYVFSNVDIFPLFFVLSSFYFLRRERNLLSAVMLGIGAGFKMYPLLLFPLFLIYQKNLKQVVVYTLGVLGTFLLILLPFVGQAMIKSSLVSGLSTRIFQGQVSLGFGEAIFPAVIGLLAVYTIACLNRKVSTEGYILLLLLTLFSFIHFHIQWLLWAAPFAVMVWVRQVKLRRTIFLVTLLAFCIPLMYNDKFMTASLFVPISPLFSLIPAPFAVVQKFIDPYLIQGVLHSALVVGSFVFGWQFLHPRDGRKDSSDGGWV